VLCLLDRPPGEALPPCSAQKRQPLGRPPRSGVSHLVELKRRNTRPRSCFIRCGRPTGSSGSSGLPLHRCRNGAAARQPPIQSRRRDSVVKMCRTPATRRSNRTILADIPPQAKSDRWRPERPDL